MRVSGSISLPQADRKHIISAFYGSITEEESKWIWQALTQAAHAYVHSDTGFSRLYQRIAERKGCNGSRCQKNVEGGLLDA